MAKARRGKIDFGDALQNAARQDERPQTVDLTTLINRVGNAAVAQHRKGERERRRNKTRRASRKGNRK